MIAILTPTRGRQQQFNRMVDSVMATADIDNNILLFKASNGGDAYAMRQYPVDVPTVYMWNDLAKEAMANPNAKLFMLGSDDMIFATPGWDKALLDHYNALENKIHVYHLQDSRDASGTPHPVVTREYINTIGYFLPPIFLHWYCDSWTVSIAQANNCFTYLKDYLLVHDKPSDKGEPDETHLSIRRRGWHTRDKAVNDSCQHYLKLEAWRLSCSFG